MLNHHIKYITFIALFISLLIGGVVHAAMYQNLNPTGDQTVAPGATDFESGELVWVNNVFVVRTRAGGTGTLRGLQLTTGASNVGIYVKSDGNVGIGTANPGYLLDVNGQMRAERYRGINSLVLNTYTTVNPASNVYLYSPGNDRDSWILLDSADTGSNWGIYHRQIDSAVSGLPGNSIGFIGGGSSLLQSYISLSDGSAYFKGNVGIATTTPSYKLDVLGGGQFSQPVIVGTPVSNPHAATKSYVDSMMQWTTTSTGIFYNSGNVGIGTTSPGGKLDIYEGTSGDTSNTRPLRVLQPSVGNGYRGGLIIFGKADSAYNMGYIGFIPNADSSLNKITIGMHSADELMVIQRNGNVGIGIAAPNEKLTVDTLGATGYNSMAFFKGNSTTENILWVGSDRSSNNAFGINWKYVSSGSASNYACMGIWGDDLGGGGGCTGLAIADGGNVGIATTTPSYALTVNGYGWFNQPVFVGTPTNAAHAATKSYVDSIIGGSTSSTSNYVLKSGDVMSGHLNMNGFDILAVDKLSVTTIDPLYQIEGAKYSTYAASIAGGVKEEFVGRGKLVPHKLQKTNYKCQTNIKDQNQNNKNSSENSGLKNYLEIGNCDLEIGGTAYEYVIDFNKVPRGSDLWVWYKAIEFSKDNVEVLATAYGVPVPISYTIKNNSIIFNAISNNGFRISNEGIEFSYRLIGKRFDWREHPTYAKDQSEPAGLIVK